MSSLDNDTQKRITDTPSSDEESESPAPQSPVTIGQSESDALRTRSAVASNSSTLKATSDTVNIATGDAKLLTNGPIISNEPDNTVRGSDGKRHGYTESVQDGRILRTLDDGTTVALANDGSKRVLETKAKDQSRQSFVYDGDKLIAIDRFGKDGAMQDSLYTHDADKPKDEQKWHRWDDRRPSEFDVNNPGAEISAPTLSADGSGTYSFTEAGVTSTSFADGATQKLGDLALSSLKDIFTEQVDSISKWFSDNTASPSGSSEDVAAVPEASDDKIEVAGDKPAEKSKLQVDERVYASMLQGLSPEQQTKWLESALKENPQAYDAAMKHYGEAGAFSQEQKFDFADQLRRSGNKDAKSEQSVSDASSFKTWLDAQPDATKKEFETWSNTRIDSTAGDLNARIAAEQSDKYNATNRFQWLDDMSNNGKQAAVDEYLAATDASEWELYEQDTAEGRTEVPTYRGSKDYSYVYDLEKPDAGLSETDRTTAQTKFEFWKGNVSGDEVKAYEDFKTKLEARGTQNYDFYSKLSDSGKAVFVDSLYSNPDQRQRKDFEAWLTNAPQRPLPDSAFRTDFAFTKDFDEHDRTTWAEHAAFAKFADASTVDGEFDNYLDWHQRVTSTESDTTLTTERGGGVSPVGEPSARSVADGEAAPAEGRPATSAPEQPKAGTRKDEDIAWLRTESGVNFAELDRVLDAAERPSPSSEIKAPAVKVENPVLSGPMVMSRREGDNLILTDFKTKATQSWKVSGAAENGLQRFSLDPPDPAGRTPMITVDSTVTGPRPKVTEVTYFKPESTNPPAYSRVTADAKGNATQVKRADGTELTYKYEQEKYGPVLQSLTTSDNSITIQRQPKGGYLVTENGQTRQENTVVVARTTDGSAVGAIAIQTAKLEYKQDDKAQSGKRSVLANVETELLRTDGTKETRTAPVVIEAAKFEQIRATILQRTGNEAAVEGRIEKITEVMVGRGLLKAESKPPVMKPADLPSVPLTIPPQATPVVPSSVADTGPPSNLPQLTQASAKRIAEKLQLELDTNPNSANVGAIREHLVRLEQVTKTLPTTVAPDSVPFSQGAMTGLELAKSAKPVPTKDATETSSADIKTPGTTGSGTSGAPSLDVATKAKLERDFGIKLGDETSPILKRVEAHVPSVNPATVVAPDASKPTAGIQVGPLEKVNPTGVTPTSPVEQKGAPGTTGGPTETIKPAGAVPGGSVEQIKAPGQALNLPAATVPSVIGGALAGTVGENSVREATVRKVAETRSESAKVEPGKPGELPTSPAAAGPLKTGSDALNNVGSASDNRAAKGDNTAGAVAGPTVDKAQPTQLSEQDRVAREKARESYSQYVQQNSDRLQLLQNAANDRLMNNTGRGADEAALREIRKVSDSASTEVARQSGPPAVEQVRGHLRDQIANTSDPGARAKLEQIDKNFEQIQRGNSPSTVAFVEPMRDGRDRSGVPSVSLNKDAGVDVSAATAVRGKDPAAISVGGGVLAGQGTALPTRDGSVVGRDVQPVFKESQTGKTETAPTNREISPVTGREIPQGTRDASLVGRESTSKDGVLPSGRELGGGPREAIKEPGLPRIELSGREGNSTRDGVVSREGAGTRDSAGSKDNNLDPTIRTDGKVAPDRATSLNPDGTVKNVDVRGIEKTAFPDVSTAKTPAPLPVGNQSVPLNFVVVKETGPGTKAADGTATKDTSVTPPATAMVNPLTSGIPNTNQSTTTAGGGKDPVAGANQPTGQPIQLQPINLPGVQIGGAPSATDPSAQLVKDPTSPSGKDPSAAGTKDPNAPATKDPSATDPNAKDPNAKDPNAKDPNAKDPNAKDPNAKDPTVKDPSSGTNTTSVDPGASKPIAAVPGRHDGTKIVEQTVDGVRIKGEKGESIEVRHDGSLIIRSEKSFVTLGPDGSVKSSGDGTSVKVNSDGSLQVGCGATFIISHDEKGSLRVRTESTESRVDGSTYQIAETTLVQRFSDGSTRISTDCTEQLTAADGSVRTNSMNSEVIETADRQVTVAVQGVDVAAPELDQGTVTTISSSRVHADLPGEEDESVVSTAITPPLGDIQSFAPPPLQPDTVTGERSGLRVENVISALPPASSFVSQPTSATQSEYTSEQSMAVIDPAINRAPGNSDVDAGRTEISLRNAEEQQEARLAERRRLEEEELRDAQRKDEAEQLRDEQLKERDEERRRRDDQLQLEQQAKRFSDAMLTAMATRKGQGDAGDARLEERQKYVVMRGDTLESIALKKLRNRKLSALIFEINKRVIPYSSESGKKLIQLTPRMVILLPTSSEVRRFESRIFGRQTLRFEYGPKPAPTGDASSRSLNPGLVRTDTTATRGGAVGSGAFSPKAIDGSSEFTSQQKRVNVEKYLGPISPESEDARIRYNCRLGDTLRSVAMRHPALRDVSLWRLLAEVNDLSTQTDLKGVPVAVLKRGTTIVLPVPPEISQFRRRVSVETQVAVARSMATPTNSFEVVSKCCPQCSRLTTSSASICPACAYPFEGRRVAHSDDVPTDPVSGGEAAMEKDATNVTTRTDWSQPANAPDPATSLLLAAGMIPLPARDGSHSSLLERSSRNVMRALSEDCRIITYGTADESGIGYRTRLEARRQEFWLPIVSYEINQDSSFRHEYTQSGSRRTTKIDLPSRSARELADNDLNSNWEAYLRNFFGAKEA